MRAGPLFAQDSPGAAAEIVELGDDSYTRRFGGDRGTTSDVLHIKEGNPAVTIVADLADASTIPTDSVSS